MDETVVLESASFGADCTKEYKDILDAVGSMTMKVMVGMEDGKLETDEIIAAITASIADLLELGKDIGKVGAEFDQYLAENLDYTAKWSADLGFKIYKSVMKMKEAKAELPEAEA